MRKSVLVLLCKLANAVVYPLAALIVKERIKVLYPLYVLRVVAAVVLYLFYKSVNSAFKVTAHRSEAVILIAEISLGIGMSRKEFVLVKLRINHRLFQVAEIEKYARKVGHKQSALCKLLLIVNIALVYTENIVLVKVHILLGKQRMQTEKSLVALAAHTFKQLRVIYKPVIEGEKVAQAIYKKLDDSNGFEGEIKSKMGHDFEVPKNRRVNCSIGIATSQEASMAAVSEALKCADSALYVVKKSTKGKSGSASRKCRPL